MPEEHGLAPVVHAAYPAAHEFVYANPPPVPWFVNRRPYCDGRNGAHGQALQHGLRQSVGGAGSAAVAGKPYRSALRAFNVADTTAPPMSPSPPPSTCSSGGGAAYGCCEFRYASSGWASSRWRRAYTPAYGGKTRDPQPQWRASKYDDGRHGADGKSGNHADPDPNSASGAGDHSRTNTENFLPRIIKPRKRKKKDRKPSGADAPSSSSSSASSTSSSSSPQLQKKVDDAPAPQKNGDPGRLYVSRSLLEGLRSAAAVAAAAAMAAEQHGIESRLAMLKSLRDFDGDLAASAALTSADDAVAMLATMADANEDEEEAEAVFCNCRYCDPQGVVWDVKEKRYSANLMQPGALSAAGAYFGAPPTEDRLSGAQPPSSPVVDTRQPKKLQVSSQIVTSLNGHRDIEIKFYSSSSEKSWDCASVECADAQRLLYSLGPRTGAGTSTTPLVNCGNLHWICGRDRRHVGPLLLERVRCRCRLASREKKQRPQRLRLFVFEYQVICVPFSFFVCVTLLFLNLFFLFLFCKTLTFFCWLEWYLWFE